MEKQTQMFTFPALTAKGKAIIRWFSQLNQWIDFVVIVDTRDESETQRIVDEAMDEYWDSDDLCYGDLVEEGLKKAGIKYDIAYHDTDDETDEYEDVWESYLDFLYASRK